MADTKNDITTNHDLGLGEKVIEENRSRFINPDGSLNVHRKGVLERGAFSPYHAMLGVSWTRFYLWILGTYGLANIIFTVLYFLAGPHAFAELANVPLGARFGDLFFYSVQVITTLGSSAYQPITVMAKVIFAIEAMTGMMGFAVAAGLIFARFSNPATKIVFSKSAIIAPYRGGTGFMVRLINGRSNELVEATATLTVAMTQKNGKRAFNQLSLERESVLVFPLSWTIVHPIVKDSPLWGMTEADLSAANAEFLVGFTAMDQDLSKKVYSRHSYLAKEVVVGAKFGNIIERTDDGTVVVDPERIHEIEKVALPATR